MMTKKLFRRWLATRPVCVRKLAAEFPLDTRLDVKGVTMWLVGYTEGDELLVSPINPNVDYEGSYAERTRLCASHVRSGEVRRIV
jgi:hypothetical protein